jgi:hypothetical protein
MYEEITACTVKTDLDGNILARPDFGDLNTASTRPAM